MVVECGRTLSVQTGTKTHNYFCLRIKAGRIISTIELTSVGDQRTEEGNCRVGSFRCGGALEPSLQQQDSALQSNRNPSPHCSSWTISSSKSFPNHLLWKATEELPRRDVGKVSPEGLMQTILSKDFKPLILKGFEKRNHVKSRTVSGQSRVFLGKWFRCRKRSFVKV